MNEVKPWSVMMIVGGLVIVGSTFLDWTEISVPGVGFIGENAWDKGLLGLYQTIIGLLVAAYGFSQVLDKQWPVGKIAGLTINQWMIALPAAVAIWGFAFQFDNNPEFGVLTTWVSGVIAAAGAVMSERTTVMMHANTPNY